MTNKKKNIEDIYKEASSEHSVNGNIDTFDKIAYKVKKRAFFRFFPNRFNIYYAVFILVPTVATVLILLGTFNLAPEQTLKIDKAPVINETVIKSDIEEVSTKKEEKNPSLGEKNKNKKITKVEESIKQTENENSEIIEISTDNIPDKINEEQSENIIEDIEKTSSDRIKNDSITVKNKKDVIKKDTVINIVKKKVKQKRR